MSGGKVTEKHKDYNGDTVDIGSVVISLRGYLFGRAIDFCSNT
jgi:hypothetical protein